MMHKSRREVSVPAECADGGNEQLPINPDITWYKFTLDEVDFLKIVTMNEETLSSSYQAGKEYYHNASGSSILDITSFDLTSGTLTVSSGAVSTFVNSMSQRFVIPQEATWTRGVYSPSAARKVLYKAVDPDDSNKMIGVLLEQDTSGHLTQITWYKTNDNGVVFSSSPSFLNFEHVKDENAQPSTNPDDIGGWTWYYASSYGNY